MFSLGIPLIASRFFLEESVDFDFLEFLYFNLSTRETLNVFLKGL